MLCMSCHVMWDCGLGCFVVCLGCWTFIEWDLVPVLFLLSIMESVFSKIKNKGSSEPKPKPGTANGDSP